MSKPTLSAEIKLRLAPHEKEQLKQLAEDAGLAMSEFVRSVIFSEKKLVFLVQGADIAAAMFQIRKDMDQLCIESVVHPDESSRLETALNEVSTQLRAVAEQITDVHDLDGTEEDNDENA